VAAGGRRWRRHGVLDPLTLRATIYSSMPCVVEHAFYRLARSSLTVAGLTPSRRSRAGNAAARP